MKLKIRSVRTLARPCLFSCTSGKSLNESLDAYAARHGSTVGIWHVVCRSNHWAFEHIDDARAMVARILLNARWSGRNLDGTARRAVRRVHPPRHIRDGASGRSYRGKSAGAQWDCDSTQDWVRLYQRTEEMERGRLAAR
jgi:hypothetical protein